ncbi:MAG: tetraacyldisaccharide 4'-kinase [Magnetospirillum sp.]|nr:tetraacyldisaccharide 4'-kinase [Magnetospirillum sp.]
MRAPDFWQRDGMPARLLSPVAAVYAWAGARRLARGQPERAAVPVICIGNIVAGRAGKTPVTIALAQRLRAAHRHPHILTRGYGGTEVGPRVVDLVRHDAARVGDEALLLAEVAPTWVARCRPEGAAAAVSMAADVILMDDGFQNPSLAKDLSLVVVDGATGFGNRRVIPAGPCREPVAVGLARADAMVVIGEDRTGVAALAAGKPVLAARLVPGPEAVALRGRAVVAFAGIGRPGKFFATLDEIGARPLACHAFPDHHPYARRDIETLLAEAGSAPLVTTAKDAVRLPADLRQRVTVLTVGLQWADEPALDRLLAGVLG